uniref:Uncharacterized protein n=1 Tax=Zea mays TaxID=4577 RepID=B4FHX1_MAIZE|nr:unknown [Zea mays]
MTRTRNVLTIDSKYEMCHIIFTRSPPIQIIRRRWALSIQQLSLLYLFKYTSEVVNDG